MKTRHALLPLLALSPISGGPMYRRTLLALVPVLAIACSEPTPTSSLPELYQLRFVAPSGTAVDSADIQSEWFPAAGIPLNATNPWRDLTVSGATPRLVYTSGDWTKGTCLPWDWAANQTSWEIAGTEPVLSFAGDWHGTLSIWESGIVNVGFDGDRVGGGGGIHNVVTTKNEALQTQDPTGKNDWFRLEVQNASMRFGPTSSPDGLVTVADLVADLGVGQVRCVSFALEAMKVSLIP